MREASADRLMTDLRAVLEDAEALLSAHRWPGGRKRSSVRASVRPRPCAWRVSACPTRRTRS